MKLYYLHENRTAYSCAKNALANLAELSPNVIEDLAMREGYYDYVYDLSPEEMPNSKLEYLFDMDEQLFENADPDDSVFWIINTETT